MSVDDSASRATCSLCGAVGEAGVELPGGWSLSTDARGVSLVCLDCTRRNARSIEAKLPEEWW